MNKSASKREAKFWAGLILKSAMQAGWSGESGIVERYGQDLADQISEEIVKIAEKLVAQSA